MTEYKLSKKAAIEGDKTGFATIKKSGGYVGEIEVAKEVTSANGTKGVELSFRAESGAVANYIYLWTENNKGESIFGYNQLMALMTCLKVSSISSKDLKVKEYDIDKKQEVEVMRVCFPQLMKKKVGLVLQSEEYFSEKHKKVEIKMNFYCAFNAETKQTATEILEKQSAERLETILANLKDKKLQKSQRYEADARADHFSDVPPMGGDMTDEYFNDANVTHEIDDGYDF